MLPEQHHTTNEPMHHGSLSIDHYRIKAAVSPGDTPDAPHPPIAKVCQDLVLHVKINEHPSHQYPIYCFVIFNSDRLHIYQKLFLPKINLFMNNDQSMFDLCAYLLELYTQDDIKISQLKRVTGRKSLWSPLWGKVQSMNHWRRETEASTQAAMPWGVQQSHRCWGLPVSKAPSFLFLQICRLKAGERTIGNVHVTQDENPSQLSRFQGFKKIQVKG